MKFLIVEPSPRPHLHPSWAQIRLRILFSNTLSQHSSLNIRDHVSLPCSTTGNIIILYLYGILSGNAFKILVSDVIDTRMTFILPIMELFNKRLVIPALFLFHRMVVQIK